MKKNLQIMFCCAIAACQVSAQDTLKVDFKSDPTQLTEEGWQVLSVSDKVAYDVGPLSFSAFGGAVDVQPIWLNSPDAVNVRAVNRTNDNYTGPLADVLRSYIAVDSRYTAYDCNILRIELTGLPAGTYTWKSYHHDFDDQHGTFYTIPLDAWEDTVRLISHSRVLADFTDGYVRSSLDSVYTYVTSVVSNGTDDVVYIDFQNTLTPDDNMDHSLKFVLINGFMLSQSGEVGIETRQINSRYLNIVNQLDGKVSVVGQNISKVDVYSMNGFLVSTASSESETVEINNLQKGIYIAKVRFFNGEILNKKFVVH